MKKLDIIARFNDKQKAYFYDKETTDAERDMAIKEFIKRDFFSLIWVLGYRDIGGVHLKEIEKLNRVKIIDKKTPVQRLWLWARGHFKTSIITVADTIRLILLNPDCRILITSNTIDISKKMLGEVKDHFTNNGLFRDLYPQYCPKENSVGRIEFGSQESFTIPCRTRILKEPTLMCSGYGTNLTGLHFDWIKADDLVTRDSVTNDTQLQQSREHFASLRSLFDNPEVPKMDVVGTPYHFADVYAQIRKTLFYDKSIIPVRNENGDVAFKERFTDAGIEALVNDPTIGPYEFSTQYMLNPIDPSQAKFKGEWLKEYDILPEGCSEYICVDPASTTKKKSDYTVIERWGRDYRGDDYLIEGIRDKLTVFQRMDKIVEIARRCKRLSTVKYEALGGRHGDLETLQKRFLDENIPIIPKETKGTAASKKDRIEQRLVPRFHGGKIFLPRACVFKSEYDGKVYDFVQLYKTEYLQHPLNEHDDILDCHTQMYEDPFIMESGVKPIAPTGEKKGITADEEEKFYKMQTNMAKANPFLTQEQIRNRIRVKQVKKILTRV